MDYWKIFAYEKMSFLLGKTPALQQCLKVALA